LGDPTRLQLVLGLAANGPESIARLSDSAAVSRQAVSKHLKVLLDAGLVRGQRFGREHVWQLRPERLDDVREQLEVIARQWDEALGRLAAFVEG
jgi:DNA-binding transcriptional ArsR family regulator